MIHYLICFFLSDVSPIESARGRFLQIILDYFISQHVVEVCENKRDHEADPGSNKANKRKSDDTRYEGDPSFALPLMYIANLYETLVGEANVRVASLNGIREKTLGVALEAAGGLYRKLTKKFPKKGNFLFFIFSLIYVIVIVLVHLQVLACTEEENLQHHLKQGQGFQNW